MSKSRGTREKDKLDALIIEPTLDEKSMAKISKIRELEARTKEYKPYLIKMEKLSQDIDCLHLKIKLIPF